MIKLIAKPLSWLAWCWGLAFPMFSERATRDEMTFPAARWMARVVLVLVSLAALAGVNQAKFIGLSNWIHHPVIRRIWLPLFALCGYSLVWLGWWLYKLLSVEIGDEPSEFPDIDRAWDQALKALEKEEIRLDETPLFLVLGWNNGEEDGLFQSSGIKPKVNQIPRDRSEPLHVTADRDGIWLTCPGISLLSQHDPAGSSAGGNPQGEGHLATLSEDNPDPYKTIGVQGMRLEDVLAAGRPGALGGDRTPARARGSIDRDRSIARLRHLCRLIKRDRLGFCPINGVLIVLPVSASDPRSRPEEIAAACRTDLTEAFDVMRMRCPVLVMVSDLERIEGFGDLIAKLPPGQTGKRMGQRFPLVADLSENEVPAKVESSVSWIIEGLFGSMIYSMLQVEHSRGLDEASEVLRGNQALFRFLVRIRERRDRLAQLVRDCIPNLPGEPLLFGGCYFAGTGNDPDSEQAFASGVFMRLVQEQDHVTWTEEAVQEDAASLRTARRAKLVFSVIIGLTLLAIAGAVGARMFRDAPAASRESASHS